MMKSVGYERFLKERYTKDDGLFQVYDTYTPNYNSESIIYIVMKRPQCNYFRTNNHE